MINRVIGWMGNVASVGAATAASISAEDFRLWGIAVVGVGATLWASVRRGQITRIQKIRAEIELCDVCRKTGIAPVPCPRLPRHRPENCPKKQFKNKENP